MPLRYKILYGVVIILLIVMTFAAVRLGQAPAPEARRGLENMLRLCDQSTVKYRVISSDEGVAFVALCTPPRQAP